MGVQICGQHTRGEAADLSCALPLRIRIRVPAWCALCTITFHQRWSEFCSFLLLCAFVLLRVRCVIASRLSGRHLRLHILQRSALEPAFTARPAGADRQRAA